jgi:hypothetical protein
MEVHLDTQCFPIEVINHIEQPEWSSVDQLIMHKIQLPNIVDCFRDAQGFGLFPAKPLFRLDP